MKPRTRNTIKILAVAVTAAAGCTRAVGPEASAEPARAGESPRTPAMAEPAQTQEPALPAGAAPAPLAPDKIPPHLATLRNELAPLDAAAVAQQTARFRPLCDKDGYPLVGNTLRKIDVTQVSAYCSTLRAKSRP